MSTTPPTLSPLDQPQAQPSQDNSDILSSKILSAGTALSKGPTTSVLKEEATLSTGLRRPHSPLKRPASELEDGGVEGSSAADEDGQAPKRASNGITRDHDEDIEMEGTKDGGVTLFQEASVEAQSTDVASTAGGNGGEQPPPSIDEQIALLTREKLRALVEGEDVYIISGTWLSRLLSEDSEVKSKKDQGPLGPIDNSDIVEQQSNDLLQPLAFMANTAAAFQSIFPSSLSSKTGTKKTSTTTESNADSEPQFVPLKAGTLGEDFEAVSEDTWNKLVSWYGLAKDSPIIKRKVVNSVTDTDDSTGASAENLIIELNPPTFTIHILRGPSMALSVKTLAKTPAPHFVASRADKFMDFLRRIKKAAGTEHKVRLYRYTPAAPTEDKRSRSPSPRFGLGKKEKSAANQKMDIDMNMFMEIENERELLDQLKDRTAEENYNGRMTIDIAGLGMGGHLILEEFIDGSWESEKTANSLKKNGVFTKAKSKAKDIVKSTSSRGSSPVRSTIMTRGREKKALRPVGKCGLQNLGNTCYMNSALQCLRNVEELSKYFLSGAHTKELNPSNPLAHGGKVAKSYANLLNHVFSPSAPASYSPSEFKATIGRFGPSFSGYGQQDSQEFLAFLLDGLHEDLNRIHKKPYIEKPESTDEMVGNPDAIAALADKCWDIYKKRNDSAVADLFGGLYKSTLVCPVCDKVSITFDPFMDLTLPLPIENIWTHEIIFVPAYGRKPFRFNVELDKNKTLKDLREHIAKKTEVSDPMKIIGSELYQHKFFQHYDEIRTISEQIPANDTPIFYELEDVPTNYPIQKYKKSAVRSMLNITSKAEDEEAEKNEKLAIPVFTSVKNQRGKMGLNLTGIPFFILVTKEEAHNYDAIRRKIAVGYQSFTTTSLFAPIETSETDTEMSEGNVVVESADYDSENVKESESEDGYVNVQMKSNPEKAPSKNTFKDTYIKDYMIQPIEAGFDRLFEIKVLKASRGDGVPTAWSINSNDYNVTLESRRTEPVAPVTSKYAGSTLTPEDSTNEDDDTDIIEPESPAEPGMLDISDEDEPAPSAKNEALFTSTTTPNDSASNLLLPKPNKKSKSVTSLNKLNTATVEAEAASGSHLNDKPLIKYGEGIICDWNPEGYEALFGAATEDNTVQGYSYFDVARLRRKVDPELEKKRHLREERKRKGIHLEDCLDEFAKEEILSDQDPWYCPRCKKHQRASKKFELWKCPDILVIHLKRFSNSRSFRDKLDVLIDFPIEGLDLTNRVGDKPEGKSFMYDLFAVDNHYGGLGGGHYTAHAKNFVDGQWYTFDDSSVREIHNPTNVVTPAAYLLFYRRRSSSPLGGPVFEEIVKSSEQAEEDDENTLMRDNGMPSPSSSTRSSRSSFDLEQPIAVRAPLAPFAGAGSSTTLFGQQPPPYSADAGEDEVVVEGPSVNFTFTPNFHDEAATLPDIPTDVDITMDDTDDADELVRSSVHDDESEMKPPRAL